MSDQKDKLLQAFNHMVDEVHASIEKAEEALSPTIDEMLENAQTMSKNLYALSQDEAKSLSNHLKRDIKNARQYMDTDGKEFKEWLNFDIELVEDRFVDMLTKAADKTWLDFRMFEQKTQENSVYRTGEYCSAGTLSCKSCDQVMKFTKNTRIPPCPKCHKTEFERLVETAETE